MKIIKHSNNCIQIDNTIFNLSLEDNYKTVKSILSEKEFNEITVPKKVIETIPVNDDYVVDLKTIDKKGSHSNKKSGLGNYTKNIEE